MTTYESESRALDAEILRVIDAWHKRGELLDAGAFNSLALRLFEYQLRYNARYARYCAELGVRSAPESWEKIPAVPAPAFKEAALTTFDPARATLVFETSGTTRGTPGRHYMETPVLYDAALLAGFDRFVLSDGARLRYLNCVPNPAERPSSSLGYMMARVSDRRGDGKTGWYLRGDELLMDAFATDVRTTAAQRQPVCIAATAFALVHVLDTMDQRGLRYELAPGSRIMETGGFKGRARIVERDELYARISKCFGLTDDAIISEYGMTELSSQYYATSSERRFAGPPWLRARVVGPERSTLPSGKVGSLLQMDLANRSSCIAVQTEDLGRQTDEGLVLIGRDRDAAPRGCSLDAEDLSVTRVGRLYGSVETRL
jgi:Acyl-protein synthetase, LuxE